MTLNLVLSIIGLFFTIASLIVLYHANRMRKEAMIILGTAAETLQRAKDITKAFAPNVKYLER